MTELPMSEDACYRACAARESAWDGHFVLAVTSTGIYCRPSCPARMPRRENCRFLATAAAAAAAGFRACRRCRPDRVPGWPGWDERGDLAARAVRMIRDGMIDEVGVPGVVGRLGVSSRTLNRVLQAEVGASAQQLDRTRRAHTARVLMDCTQWGLEEIALSAGFGSPRRFREVMREEFGAPPSRLPRGRGADRDEGGRMILALRLPGPRGAAATAMLGALRTHAVAGLETASQETITRLIRTPAGAVLARTGCAGRVELDLPGLAALTPALAVVRRWLASDADTAVAEHHLADDPLLAPLIAARPGLRIPGVVDGAEFAMFTVLGQLISLNSARTVQGRLVEAFGEPTEGLGGRWRFAPAPGVVAEAGADRLRAVLRLTRTKAEALQRLATVLAAGLRLDPDTDRTEARRILLGIRGIGPWTTEFIAMRALGDPDACPAGDLVLRRVLAVDSEREVLARAADWSPWRGQAIMHLWTEASYT
ncbi:Ada metal-binding domain-containing protein [Arachnia propionica]|uniref:DNA-3-methyladenine glycosylase II n=1 Tax=Arachnia propionica TaxID=1750 RepID=A0A3P1WSW1_9ACTN|nr:Ada metal-binding domain-containing protein [Arachnia propionica]RRD49709.1 DNA-3-methyladenine glycosylase 2 family protein [Arachnia propionica]